MLLAHGFLRKVFEVFEKFKTSVDMITTSEVAVSLTIDNNKNLDAIVKEVQEFCTVEVDNDLSIVCVVGSFTAEKEGYAFKIFDALKHIPIRMISYGGSENNVSVLVDSKLKKDAKDILTGVTVTGIPSSDDLIGVAEISYSAADLQAVNTKTIVKNIELAGDGGKYRLRFEMSK